MTVSDLRFAAGAAGLAELPTGGLLWQDSPLPAGGSLFSWSYMIRERGISFGMYPEFTC